MGIQRVNHQLKLIKEFKSSGGTLEFLFKRTVFIVRMKIKTSKFRIKISYYITGEEIYSSTHTMRELNDNINLIINKGELLNDMNIDTSLFDEFLFMFTGDKINGLKDLDI